MATTGLSCTTSRYCKILAKNCKISPKPLFNAPAEGIPLGITAPAFKILDWYGHRAKKSLMISIAMWRGYCQLCAGCQKSTHSKFKPFWMLCRGSAILWRGQLPDCSGNYSAHHVASSITILSEVNTVASGTHICTSPTGANMCMAMADLIKYDQTSFSEETLVSDPMCIMFWRDDRN